MNPLTLLLLGSAAIINAGASALLKYSSVYKSAAGAKPAVATGIFLLAMCLYGACFPLYSAGLAKTRLSLAQPVFAAVSYLATAILALLFFKDQYTLARALGLLLILGGIVLVARS